MNLKDGNLEFKREQLFGMKIGINLKMKVCHILSSEDFFFVFFFHVLHEVIALFTSRICQ